MNIETLVAKLVEKWDVSTCIVRQIEILWVDNLTSSKSQSPDGSLVDIETSKGLLLTLAPSRKFTGM